MGRKNRIKKHSKDATDQEVDVGDDLDLLEANQLEFQSDEVWKVGRELREYCQQMSLPLCDYMSHQTLQEFIGSMLSHNGYWDPSGPGGGGEIKEDDSGWTQV